MRMIAIPRDFVLADRTTMIAHRCTRVWTKDAELGLAISRSLSLKGVVPGPLMAARAWCLEMQDEPQDARAVVHI